MSYMPSIQFEKTAYDIICHESPLNVENKLSRIQYETQGYKC